MRTLQHAEFVALLAAADISQAAFARLAGVSARQVNKWCRGRAALPRWAALLAIALREVSVEALTIMLEELPLASPDTAPPLQNDNRGLSSSKRQNRSETAMG
jgi:transcriptional regulator with XRE-family HTH domain